VNKLEAIQRNFLLGSFGSDFQFHPVRLNIVSWVQPGKVKEVLVAWRRRMKKSLAFGVWKLIPLAIWWSVWKERNRRIFEGKDLSLHEFKLYFLRMLYSWSQPLDGSANLTFVDFVDILKQGY